MRQVLRACGRWPSDAEFCINNDKAFCRHLWCFRQKRRRPRDAGGFADIYGHGAALDILLGQGDRLSQGFSGAPRARPQEQRPAASYGNNVFRLVRVVQTQASGESNVSGLELQPYAGAKVTHRYCHLPGDRRGCFSQSGCGRNDRNKRGRGGRPKLPAARIVENLRNVQSCRRGPRDRTVAADRSTFPHHLRQAGLVFLPVRSFRAQRHASTALPVC